MANSLRWGAANNTAANAATAAKARRACLPPGTVRGSVTIKAANTKVSGEKATRHQKSLSHSGTGLHTATMQWPEPANTPSPAARLARNARAIWPTPARRPTTIAPTTMRATAPPSAGLAGPQ